MERTRGLCEIVISFVVLGAAGLWGTGSALMIVGSMAAFLFFADGLRVLFKGDKAREQAAQRALAVEAEVLAAAMAPRCPECDEKLKPAVLACDACGATVRKTCASCKRPMPLDARACLFCGSGEFV